MATISASPRVVGGSLEPLLWSPGRPRPTTAVTPGVSRRPVSTATPGSVDIPWRLLAAIAAVFVGTLLVSGVAARVASSAAAPHPAGAAAAAESLAHPARTVVDGDTLWSISESLAPQADPRSTVAAIRELNGLPADHVLQVGEVLLLPDVE